MASTAPLAKFGGLALTADPREMLKQAQDAAQALMDLIKQRPELSVNIGGRNHLRVEAWETLAYFCGLSPRVVDVRHYYDEITEAQGFEAIVEAIRVTDQAVLGSARALCLNNEDNWDMRPKYEMQNGRRVEVGEAPVPTFQLHSMAQTRATGKVFRTMLAFIVQLAGYDPCPAEEITGNEPRREQQQPGRDPQARTNGKAAERISEPQRKRLFAIGNERQMPMSEIVNTFQRHGFKRAFEIEKGAYDAIIAEIQNWKPSAAA